jgi:hypothetical protein
MLPNDQSRSESEVIPPGYPDGGSMQDRRHVYVRRIYRIYPSRMGPFGILVLGLAIALIAAVMFFVLLGAVLIWIPVVVLLVATAIISGLLRR